MRWPVFFLSLLVFLAAASASEDDDPTAASVTEPGRSLDRALDVVLAGDGDNDSKSAKKRTVLFLLDPAPALKAAGFAEAFGRALDRIEGAGPSIGIAVTGLKRVVVLAPTDDRALAEAHVHSILSAPAGNYQNVTADVRKAAGALSRRAGKRELVLVTLENGDAEDDLEATVGALKRAKVRFSCISREAFLSDSYWVSSSRQTPRGIAFGAGDGAYVTLPWGWLWQMSTANERTPSGFGTYGLGRLAAATDGRVFLEAPPGAAAHRCSYIGMCNACAEDHLPTDEAFHSRRMRTLAPSVASRKEAGADMARDPCFRLLLKAWAQAGKAGLLRSRPSVRLASGGVKPERRQQGAWAAVIGSGLGFSRFASKADALAKTCDKQITWLTTEIGKLAADAGSRRHRAMVEFTLAMLHVTKTNLIGCAAWCRDVGPVLLEDGASIAAPEVEQVVYRDRVSGVGYNNICLCHGVKPFFEFRMPGGLAWDAALKQLDQVYTAYMRRWAHTPYALALRHQGIARFHFTYRGTTPPPPPRKRTGSDTEKPTTDGAKRPARTGGGGSSGGSGAPTTGGG